MCLLFWQSWTTTYMKKNCENKEVLWCIHRHYHILLALYLFFRRHFNHLILIIFWVNEFITYISLSLICYFLHQYLQFVNRALIWYHIIGKLLTFQILYFYTELYYLMSHYFYIFKIILYFIWLFWSCHFKEYYYLNHQLKSMLSLDFSDFNLPYSFCSKIPFKYTELYLVLMSF